MPHPFRGSLVLVYLHSPRERLWGVLREVNQSGIWVEGIDLDSFEDWARQVAREGEPTISLSMAFYPMLRVEKILLDRGLPDQPSMGDRFQQLVGRTVAEYLGLELHADPS